MDHVEIWNKAKALLSEELASISYINWIEKPLKPVYVADNKLVLEVISEFNEKTIRPRYLPMITTAVSQAAGREMIVELISVNERIAWQEKQKTEEQEPIQGANMFNSKSTFDTFVVGSSNRFAHAASLAVAEAPGKAYNPLFLYGGVGLGKTHLMHAIGHFIQEHFPNTRMLYLPAETFTNELVTAIKSNKNIEFRNRFRNVDVLMLDDIQFIAGRDSTQEEFFHTFNALHSAGKQIIISSDKPPKEIAKLEERLRSRFEWGLIADINKPDLETRVAILQKKAEDELLRVDGEVLTMIAERVASNIRELEGCLTRLVAYSSLTGRPIDAQLAEEALKEIFARSEPRHVTCEDVMEAVATYYNVTVDDLKGPRRSREVAVPRQIAMYIAREIVGAPLTMIGENFGGRDHSTVNHACQKVDREMKASPTLNNLVNDLMQQLQER